jgi:hypothetical protein
LSGLPIREKTGVETRVRVRPVRLTAAEDAVLHEIARAQSITVSDLLRRLIHAAVGLGPLVDGEDRELLRALRFELNAIGVNLNQIARAMNTGLVPPNKLLAERLVELKEGLVALGGGLRSMCVKAARPFQEAVTNSAATGGAGVAGLERSDG